MRRLSWFAAAMVAAGLAWAGWQLTRFGPVSVGYPAKIICSETFLAGRELPAIMADLVQNPVLSRLDIEVDRDDRQVTVSLFGVFSQRAVFRPGLGCTRVSASVEPEDWPALTATSTVASGSEPAPQPSPELATAVAAAFEEPGPTPWNTRAFVVVHHGSVVAERYADGFSAASRFPGWSMAKSVTGALAGLLVGDGRLDVEAPAPVPEWSDASDPRGAITLDDLLRMSSGLDFNEDYGLVTDVTRMLFVEPAAGAFAARSRLAHPPGTRWSYSSGTTNIVARIVHAAADGDLSFARRRLFGPLGMDSAVLETDAAGCYIGSSFLYATARDWARFGRLFLQDGVWDDGRLLPTGWVEYSTTPTPGAPKGKYGAHWWLNAGTADHPEDRTYPQLPPDAFWADGYDGQMVMVVPSRDAVIVRLGLTKHESAYPEGDILAGVLAALPESSFRHPDVGGAGYGQR